MFSLQTGSLSAEALSSSMEGKDNHKLWESKKQPVVSLDVGGKSFKMAESTLERYPDCLIAKMVAEFPSVVNQGKELYIDRDPFAFPWILQIHRDGDYKSCIPEMSMESLQKELNFYQLPSFEELGLCVLDLPLALRDRASRDLVQQIMDEIDACGMKDMYPWDILLYQKIVDGELVCGRQVFISLPSGLSNFKYVSKRGHNEFFTALWADSKDCRRILKDNRLILKPRGTDVRYAVTQATDDLIAFLKRQTKKLGWRVSKAGIEFVDEKGNTQTFNALKVTYNAD